MPYTTLSYSLIYMLHHAALLLILFSRIILYINIHKKYKFLLCAFSIKNIKLIYDIFSFIIILATVFLVFYGRYTRATSTTIHIRDIILVVWNGMKSLNKIKKEEKKKRGNFNPMQILIFLKGKQSSCSYMLDKLNQE